MLKFENKYKVCSLFPRESKESFHVKMLARNGGKNGRRGKWVGREFHGRRESKDSVSGIRSHVRITVGGFASEGKPGIPRGRNRFSPVPRGWQDDRNEKGKSMCGGGGPREETRPSLVSTAIGIPPINLHLSWSA